MLPDRTTTWLGCLFAVVMLAGCSSSSAPEPPVSSTTTASAAAPTVDACAIAVIDLDRVAAGIDAVDKMRSARIQYELQLLEDVKRSTATLFGETKPMGDTFAEFDRSASTLLDALPATQQKEFAQKIRAAQSQIDICQRQVRDDFLNEVRPYAFQIARGQGCQLVLTTDQVYVAAEQVDITSQVIEKIKTINAAAAQATPPADRPAPKLASGGSFPIQ